MESVIGIGGFFFRARDPKALANWYQERLGITTVPETYEGEVWRQHEGETVFAPFPQDSEMIGPPEHTWMINFRVGDIDAIVIQLRDAERRSTLTLSATRMAASPSCAIPRETGSSSGSR